MCQKFSYKRIWGSCARKENNNKTFGRSSKFVQRHPVQFRSRFRITLASPIHPFLSLHCLTATTTNIQRQSLLVNTWLTRIPQLTRLSWLLVTSQVNRKQTTCEVWRLFVFFACNSYKFLQRDEYIYLGIGKREKETLCSFSTNVLYQKVYS